MKNVHLLIILALILVLASACQKTSKITCSGSTTVLPIAQATAEAFMDKHPGVNISIRGGGSGVGIAALQNGNVEIANSSRPMKPEEISQAKSKGLDPVAHAVALDGVAVVVHANNEVSKLSIGQIRDIYTGKIQNWSEIGGPELPIVVISRDVASGTFEVFNEKALDGSKVISEAQLLASNNAVATTVASTPGGIGYLGLGYIQGQIKAVTVDGITPSAQTVRDGSYPLSRELYMYTNGQSEGGVSDFLSFILSAEGQKIVEEQGFIALK